jgi:hypothetical protein
LICFQFSLITSWLKKLISFHQKSATVTVLNISSFHFTFIFPWLSWQYQFHVHWFFDNLHEGFSLDD